MTQIFRFKQISIILVAIALTACAGAAKPAQGEATGAQLLPPNWKCYDHCHPPVPPAESPLPIPHHGLITSSSSGGRQSFYVVDFDSKTFSSLDTEIAMVAGKYEMVVDERHDILLSIDDLSDIRKITNSMWASLYSDPPYQVGLGASWDVSLIDGAIMRAESGLGSPGGHARDLVLHFLRIEERQLGKFLMQGRHWYRELSCYNYPRAGQTSIPYPRIFPAVSSESEKNFSTSPPVSAHFKFYMEGQRWICADW